MSDSLLPDFQFECTQLLDQSLSRIDHCLGQLSHEQLWWQPGPNQNSIGILLRHLAGNLNQWAVDGVTGGKKQRDRAQEFESSKQESSAQVYESLGQVVLAAKHTLAVLTADDLKQRRTIQGFDVTGLGAIMHTIPHLVGHTHQIVMLTRLQLGENYRFHWDPDAPRDKVPL